MFHKLGYTLFTISLTLAIVLNYAVQDTVLLFYDYVQNAEFAFNVNAAKLSTLNEQSSLKF